MAKREFATTIPLRLEQSVADRINRIAEREGNTVSGVMRRIVAIGLASIDEHELPSVSVRHDVQLRRMGDGRS